MEDSSESNKTSTSKKGMLGVLWTSSGSIVYMLLQFVVLGILARILSPEEFGIVALVLVLVNFTQLFIDMGIASAIVQMQNITKEHISQGYALSILIGVLLGIIFYFSGPWLGQFFNISDLDEPIRFFALFLPFNSINAMSHAMLYRKLNYSVIVKCDVLSYLFGMGLTSIILAYLGFGYWSLIYGHFATTIILTISMLIIEKPYFSFRFSKVVSKDLLFFGSGHTLSTTFNYFAENMDNLVVGKYLSQTALGIYSKAFQLFATPASFFGGVYDKVLFPILSKKNNDKALLGKFYIFSNSVCFGVLIPMSFAIYVNAELIIRTILGDQWDEAILILQILVLGLAFRFGTRINKSYLKSMGLVYTGASFQFIFAIMMLISTYIGSKINGLIGVAVGVFITTIINYLIVVFKLYSVIKFDIKQFSGTILKSLLVFIPLFLLAYFSFEFLDSMYLQLLISVIVYAPIALYFLFSKKGVLFNSHNNEMLSIVLNALPTGSIQKLTAIKSVKSYFEELNLIEK